MFLFFVWQQQVLVSIHYRCKPWQARRRNWDHIHWVTIELIVRANFQIQQKVFTLKRDGKLSPKRKCTEEHWYNQCMYRLLWHPHNQSEHLHSSYCLFKLYAEAILSTSVTPWNEMRRQKYQILSFEVWFRLVAAPNSNNATVCIAAFYLPAVG